MNKHSSLPDTISLIGMPGAGKSTVGVLLAKMAGMAFRDTDLDIQLHARATLQEILDRDGHLKLREIEEDTLLHIPLERSVISTGGSVVYSTAAMRRLAAAGPIVYLQTDLEILEHRVAFTPNRGIASDQGQSFADIYAERTPLYTQWANMTLGPTDASAEQMAYGILKALSAN